MDDALFPLAVESIGLPELFPAERHEMDAGAAVLRGFAEIRRYVQSRWYIGSFTRIGQMGAPVDDDV